MLYVEILERPGRSRFGSRVGGLLPAHAPAVGKAILANLPPSTIREVLSGRLERVGPRTVIVPQMVN